MNICVYGASSKSIENKYIQKCEELGEIIAKRGHGLVFGGGADGVMGACARGAKRKDGFILGISPSFFNVDGVLYEECNKLIYTETMRERKKLLEDYSDAFIIAPGGIGTFEEFYEVLTLKQLALHNKPIIIYNIYGFYDKMISFLKDIKKIDFIREKTLDLFKVMDNVDEIIEYIENYIPEEINIVETRG